MANPLEETMPRPYERPWTSERYQPPVQAPAVAAFALPKLTTPSITAAQRYAVPVEVTRTTLVGVMPRMLTAFAVGAPIVYRMEGSNVEARSGSNPANVAFSAK
jgi:hypothetical protein